VTAPAIPPGIAAIHRYALSWIPIAWVTDGGMTRPMKCPAIAGAHLGRSERLEPDELLRGSAGGEPDRPRAVRGGRLAEGHADRLDNAGIRRRALPKALEHELERGAILAQHELAAAPGRECRELEHHRQEIGQLPILLRQARGAVELPQSQQRHPPVAPVALSVVRQV